MGELMKILKKDITTVESGIIAHGVNCQRAMGSGVALALLNKWALVREQYMTRGKGKQMLGTVDEVKVEPNISVFNCYTQEYFGREGKRYASPAAICVALLEVADIACERKVPMYIPLIGCQLGGLSVEQDLVPILEQIELMYEDLDLNICVL